MVKTPLTPSWFQANAFHPSADGGWECPAGPDRWVRWNDGMVYIGNRQKANSAVNAPPQELVAENITRVEHLLAVFEQQKLNGPAYLD